ncbi:MAG: response regulator [Candidatus Schekmanbacteria bacterium]|nr:response regulator [Candidatus Schekmanbacteria bacterium]
MSKILFIDDDETMREAVSRAIGTMGHICETAADGFEGLKKIKEENYDLVITDMRMPKLDGKEFTKRAIQFDKGILVIVLTGYGSVESAVELLKLGAYDYLEKPLNFEDLEFVINRALEKKKMEGQLSFFKGMIYTLIISIPIWLILGIILAAFLS